MESLFNFRTNFPPIKEIASFESWEDPDKSPSPIVDIDT